MPVTALLNYLARRGSEPGALFQWQDRTPLSKTRFVEAVRQALTAALLLAQDYASHSFRIGAATTAAMAGLEDSAIQTLGQWKSASYQLYIWMDPVSWPPCHHVIYDHYLSLSWLISLGSNTCVIYLS